MDPFNLLLAGKLIDISWDAFSGPVKQYVSTLFEKKPGEGSEKIEGLVNSDAIATGVAIGYFHNFLKPLDGAIAYDRFLVFKNDSKSVEQQIAFTPEQYEALGTDGIKQMCTQKTESYEYLGSYDSTAFKFTIVYPSNLENQNFSRVNDFLRNNTKRGSYYNKPNARPYGLNYNIQEGNIIDVIDYARPIEAIYNYYSGDKHYSEAEIAQLQKEEIELFIATIYRLLKKSTHHLFSKTEFKPLQ
ncbi:MAG: hypothetical protein GKS05_12960 [Nitrospirales bacterium]|nr:hypothetical protein [Nitrospirales bacterium]